MPRAERQNHHVQEPGRFHTAQSTPKQLHSFNHPANTLGPAAAVAKSLQSCPTLCDPIDGSPPGSPVPGILQARIRTHLRNSLLPWWLRQKRNCPQCRRARFKPWVRKSPWRRAWQPPPVFLPGESPKTEEPGGLQSTGLQKVGHD